MSFFGGGFKPGLGDIFGKKNEPTIVDKVEMIFKDTKTEGKKDGYNRAAKEYDSLFYQVEKDFSETKRLLAQQVATLEINSDLLISKLTRLEKQKKGIEQQLHSKSKEVSSKYNIPLGNIQSALSKGSMIGPLNHTLAIDVLYNYKEKQYREAERKGYFEAKSLYDNKLAKMKAELDALKKKGSKEIISYNNLIIDITNEINYLQMQVVELKMLI